MEEGGREGGSQGAAGTLQEEREAGGRRAGPGPAQQAHGGRPYSPTTVGFLIIKLNYRELSGNFRICGINVKAPWQRSHPFPSPLARWLSLPIRMHPPKWGTFPNSVSPCTPQMSAQARCHRLPPLRWWKEPSAQRAAPLTPETTANWGEWGCWLAEKENNPPRYGFHQSFREQQALLGDGKTNAF